jgi:hypothetical protein
MVNFPSSPTENKEGKNQYEFLMIWKWSINSKHIENPLLIIQKMITDQQNSCFMKIIEKQLSVKRKLICNDANRLIAASDPTIIGEIFTVICRSAIQQKSINFQSK